MIVIRYYWLHYWLHFTGVPAGLVHLGHYPGNNNNITILFLIFHAKPRIFINKDCFPLETSHTFRAASRHSSKRSIESDERCSRHITVNRTTLHQRYRSILPVLYYQASQFISTVRGQSSCRRLCKFFVPVGLGRLQVSSLL